MIDFLDSDLRLIMEGPFSRRDVTRHAGTDNAAPVTGIFNAPVREGVQSRLGGQLTVKQDARDISFTFMTEDTPKRNEVFIIGGKEYTAYKILDDGYKMVTVFLHEKKENVPSTP